MLRHFRREARDTRDLMASGGNHGDYGGRPPRDQMLAFRLRDRWSQN